MVVCFPAVTVTFRFRVRRLQGLIHQIFRAFFDPTTTSAPLWREAACVFMVEAVSIVFYNERHELSNQSDRKEVQY